jgi:CO/xanthine dehydrogenase Mo-binding subunit
MEAFVYDDSGNPLGTSFMDYLLPTITEAPHIVAIASDTTVTSTNLLGVKGAGEGGVTGVAAAIASAIENAVGRPGLVTTLPIKAETLINHSRP